jgi:outer membrane protein OmpU
MRENQMKKVLFATTALVASAGIASAQGVTLSGAAEMGIVGGDATSAGNIEFWNDIDVKFSLSGETDNGLTFGATIDLDEVVAAGPGIPGTGNPASAFLSGNFGTITMGDTDGAFDWALKELDQIADINDSNTGHSGFNGNAGLDGTYDGQIARYDYSFGDFAFAVSAELDDSGAGDPVFGIGGKYSGDLGGVTLGVGLGYQSNGVNDILGISVDAGMSNGISLGVNYSDLDGAGGHDSHAGIGAWYSMDALSVGVNYGVYQVTGGGDHSGVGVAANYDLGGGAVVQFGYGSSTSVGGVNTDSFSLGVAMSF